MISIKRGILQGFNTSSYTATILLMEATSAFLSGVPVANHVDGTSALPGALCAVLFFDENNPTDAVVIAIFANGTQGLPTPAPGRVVFVTPTQQISGAVIAAGATATFTLAGVGGIPLGALGVLYKVYFAATAAPAHLDLAAHGGDLNKTNSVGDLATNSQILNGEGFLPLSSDGKIDIRANGNQCTVNLFTYGYVM